MPRGLQKNFYHFHYVEYGLNEYKHNIIKSCFYKTRGEIMTDNRITSSGITERINQDRKHPRLYKNIYIERVNIPIYKKTKLEADTLSTEQ